MGAAEKGFAVVAKTLQVIGQIVLFFMMATICYDALMRYIFAAPTSWSLEINTFLIIYLAVMTAADVKRTNEHIQISFFSDMLGASAQRAVTVFIGIVGIVFCVILTYRGGIMTAQAWQYGERVSSSFGTPMVLPYAMIPIGFGALALQFLLETVKAVLGLDTGDGDEPDDTGSQVI